MKTSLWITLAWALAAAWAQDVPDPDPNRFADAFARFAAEDRAHPVAPGGIVFVGSSSVRMLDIETVLPGIEALNRGFGGAHISDLNHYIEQAVLQYEPETVVFFCGGNDLWSGKSVAQVTEDFHTFTRRLFDRLPRAHLLVLAWRPSPARWRIVDQERAFNAALAATAAADDRITYIEGTATRFLSERGGPIPELYADDGLHMSPAGYAIWGELLRPYLKPRFLVGGDISTLAKIEQLGGVFRDDRGPGDAIEILRRAGWNCFRLRLFVQPTLRNAVVQDLPYTLALARRIKASGAQLLLDLHYSDTWADPAHQTQPAAWADLSFAELTEQVFRYSSDVITAFKDANVLPDIVQVGNEITPGFLWPDGQIVRPGDDTEHWAEFTTLLKAGIDGVRAPLGEGDHLRVMIHIDCGARPQRTRWFFDHLLEFGVAFDIIGQSYYPWWHGTMQDVRENQALTATTYHKDIMIVETAYPWTNARWWEDRPNMAWPITAAGQAEFLAELAEVVRQTPENRGIGVIYWYPEAIEVEGMNVWNGGATAVFDHDGRLLPAAAALTEPVSLQQSVFIGTYTRPGGSEGIYRCLFDRVDGSLSNTTLFAEAANPSFLDLDVARRQLVSTGSHDGGGTVYAFAVDPAGWRVTTSGRQSSGGRGPCHVCLSPDGRFVLAANYADGSVAVLPILGAGRLGPATDVVRHTGGGPVPDRQEGPHPHQVLFSPDGQRVLVPDLGIDRVKVYRWQASGKLTAEESANLVLPPGAGPRHAAFSPDGRRLYVLNELNNTVVLFDAPSDSNRPQARQTVSTLPPDFTGFNKAAEITVHPNGRFLYASNRGHDSVAVFRIDPADGRLSLVEHERQHVRTPRHFCLDPAGRYALVANRDSDTVRVYRIDLASGGLEPLPHSADVPSPVCVRFWP